MIEIVLETPTVIEKDEKKLLDNNKKRINRWTKVLYLSVTGGIISAFSGLALGAIYYLGSFGESSHLDQIGNLMIIAGFVLMMLGAHALDKINAIKSQQKQL